MDYQSHRRGLASDAGLERLDEDDEDDDEDEDGLVVVGTCTPAHAHQNRQDSACHPGTRPQRPLPDLARIGLCQEHHPLP